MSNTLLPPTAASASPPPLVGPDQGSPPLSSRYRAGKEDIVISYSHHHDGDVTWIRNDLVPRLQARGLSIFLDALSLRVGEDWRARIADAITKCRHVVLVLTPEWARSEECRFEASGAFLLDPWGIKRKLLLVHRRDCFDLLPDWLKRRHMVDFRAPQIADGTWTELLEGCLADVAEAGEFAQVTDLSWLATSTARSLGEISGLLAGPRKRIGQVIGYKEMHDIIHQMELPWGLAEDAIRQLARDAADRASWRELRNQATTSLEPKTAELAAAAELHLGKKGDGVSAALRRGLTDLAAVLAARQPAAGSPAGAPAPPADVASLAAKLVDIASRIRKELSRQSTRLNDWIVNSVRDIALDDLEPPVKELLAELEADPETRPASGSLTSRLHAFLEVLGDLQSGLTAHIESHDVLQRLHDELLHVAPDDWGEREDFRSAWLGPREPLQTLLEDRWRDLSWACEITAAGAEVESLLDSPTLNLDDARDRFDDFRSRVFREFRAVDTRLRQFCAARLQPLGEQLAHALKLTATP